jgi:hypothetical protein
MPIRIYDIAKKLGVETAQVLAKAKELGISTARVPSSSLDRITAEYLESHLIAEKEEMQGRGLQSFHLGNFKAFAETQSIPIRPLTLIFGANSSGKSSLVHGLLLARHALDTGQIDISRTALGGDSLDLGGFRQYVHRRDASRRVELIAELSTDILRGNAWRLLKGSRAAKVTLNFGMPLDDTGKPVAGQGPRLIAYEVEAEGRSVLRLSRRPDETMQLDRLDEEAIQPLIDAVLLSNSTTQTVDAQSDRARVLETVRSLISTLRFKCGMLLPEHLLGEEFTSARPPQLAPVGRGNRAEELANIARLFVPRAIADVIGSINAALQGQFERLTYLGPLRSFPARHLAFAEDDEPNWYAGGGYAWNVVRTNEEVRNAVNKWLGSAALQTKYQLALQRLFTGADAQAALERGLGWIAGSMERKMREAERDEDRVFPFDNLWDETEYVRLLMDEVQNESAKNPVDELVLIDRRTNTPVTHRDVGIGVSQVLPVLVHAYADRNRIVAIEQPEIHLHPALQAELGDLFIESALGERRNTFFIETHSEHVILRILRRVRDTTEGKLEQGRTPVRPEDVTVAFVEPTAKGSVVRHLPVTPDGDFGAPWPGGFFAERFQDLP